MIKEMTLAILLTTVVNSCEAMPTPEAGINKDDTTSIN